MTGASDGAASVAMAEASVAATVSADASTAEGSEGGATNTFVAGVDSTSELPNDTARFAGTRNGVVVADESPLPAVAPAAAVVVEAVKVDGDP